MNLAHAVDFDGTVFQLDDGQPRLSQPGILANLARQTFMKFLFEKEARTMNAILSPTLELTVLLPACCLPISR